MTDTQALRERVAKAMAREFDRNQWSDAVDAAIAVCMEEAATVAEAHGVGPETNVYGGGPEWYRHGQNIARDIRALKPKTEG